MNDERQNQILLKLLGAKAFDDIDISNIDADEWNGLIQRAKEQRSASLLYYRLANSNLIIYVPKDMLLTLHKIHLGTLAVNMRLQKEFSHLVNLLKNEGISVIVLKGLALAETIYDSSALRPMSDIDLIIKGEEFDKANRIMIESGWENLSYLNRIDFDKQHYKHINYTKGNINIDVHPKMYELPLLDPWIKAVRAKIANTETFILGKEDFLMHLCLHLEDHYRTGASSNLIWYLDIVEYLRQYKENIDWNYVIVTAKKNKADKYLHKALKAVNEDFDCNIPSEILYKLGNIKNNSLSVDYTLKPVAIPIRNFNALISEAFGPQSFPIHHRLYIAFRNIFPHKDFMINRYGIKNSNLFFLYYFVRIILGVGKFFGGLFHLPFYLMRRRHKLQDKNQSPNL